MRARVPVVEIMTQSPVTIPADATAKEAAGLMRDREIGSLVVVETGKPMGIVTERERPHGMAIGEPRRQC